MTNPISMTIRRALGVVALAGCIVAVGCPTARTQERPSSPTEVVVNDLQQDIDLLGDFNRLDLTREQMRELIAEVEAIQARMRENQTKRDAILALLQPHLEAQKAALLKDEPVSPTVTQQIKVLADQLNEFDDKTDRDLVTEFGPRLHKLLTQPQIDILTWVDEARLNALEQLAWARDMTDEEYQAEAQVTAQNLAEGRDITKEKVLDIFRRARAMSEADYGKNRDALAGELLPAMRGEADSIDTVLLHRLQPPRLLSVLGEKLGQMK
jgi:hypothetical protein